MAARSLCKSLRDDSQRQRGAAVPPSPSRGPHARVELLLGPHEQRLEADGAAAAQRQHALQHTQPSICFSVCTSVFASKVLSCLHLSWSFDGADGAAAAQTPARAVVRTCRMHATLVRRVQIVRRVHRMRGVLR